MRQDQGYTYLSLTPENIPGEVDYVQILENGNVFLHVLETLHVVHNSTSFVLLETDLPPKSFSSSFLKEKGRRNFYSACLIPGTLTISLAASEP